MSKLLVQHAAGDLWKPVVQRPEKREHGSSDQHVMEVSHDEERVVNLPVDRHRSEHHTAKSSNEEDKEEAKHPQKRQAQPELSCCDGSKPAEELNSCRHHDHQRCGCEKAETELRETSGEHVMHPDSEADEPGRKRRKYEGRVPEHLSSRKGRHDGGDQAGAGEKDDIDFRMPKEPEQVLV